MFDLFSLMESYRHRELLSDKQLCLLSDFFKSYSDEARLVLSEEKTNERLRTFLQLLFDTIEHPPEFEIYHPACRKPFDYYRFGLEFIEPLIDWSKTQFFGKEYAAEIIELVKKGENVVLLANHQTEPDPQILSLLLEKIDKRFPEKIIFLAGHRVTNDPLAIPMSLGCNLLCIHSKRHLLDPFLSKKEKILHNQKAMKKMTELLSEGGHCFYVAPSGGRDRPDIEGIIRPASLDEDSLELFYLIAKSAKRPTSFYPLTLQTYDLMPPPTAIGGELGEKRLVKRTPVRFCFSQKVEMDPPSDFLNRKAAWKEERAKRIWETIGQNYWRQV